MATGTALLDFGAFPGASDASVAVADASISAWPTSKAEAWLVPVATADHTADEHLVESVKVMAGPPVAGVGFTIYGVNTSEILEARTCKGTKIYGKFTVGWAWA